jgi:hypothetical protein
LSGSFGVDLDHRHAITEQEQGLRVLHRHDHEDLVEIIDPDLEDRGDVVLRRAHRCRTGWRALRVMIEMLLPTVAPSDSARRLPIATCSPPGLRSESLPKHLLALERGIVADVLDCACRGPGRIRLGRCCWRRAAARSAGRH